MNAFPLNLLRQPATVWICTGLLFTLAGPARADEERVPEDGQFVDVVNPITDASRTDIENRIDRARNSPGRNIKKVVFVFNPNESEAATANYGACLDLARYIQKLNGNGITTIAFVQKKTTRHTVLPVLACKDLIMASNAEIGDVAGGERIPVDDVVEYKKLAGHNREAVVTKMINPDIEVITGLENGNVIFVDSGLARKPGPFADVIPQPNKVILAGGSIGLYRTDKAQQFQLCAGTAESKEELATKYNILAGRDDGYPSRIKAAKIDLVGTIDETFKRQFFGQLKDVRSRNETLVFITIECSGGNAKIAREIADELAELRNDKKELVRTVAFIPSKAPDLATFIAFGCSEIVMFKGSDKASEASFGDFEQFLASTAKAGDAANTPEFIRRNLEEVAGVRGYAKILVDGMIDRDLKIYHVRNRKNNAFDLVSGPQYDADQKGEKNFTIVKAIKQQGSLLKFDASLARELRIAQGTVNNRDIKEVYSIYGVQEKDVRDSQPGWIDDFAAFLRRPAISFILIFIGVAGLILEVKMPGATIPGLIALVCFVTFFWAQAYANGNTVYLAIALFVLGLILLGVEIFILPGFGVTGISGVLLILAGIGLATLEKAPTSTDEWFGFARQLLQYGLSLVASGILAFILARYLPKIPYANRLMLVPPSDKPDIEGEMQYMPGAEVAAALLGQVGTATSMLRPAGMARFGDQYVDVVTEGDFIEPGTPIQVIEVESNRIVVKRM